MTDQTTPEQHVPSPEVSATAQSGNAAQDIVAGLLGKYANPATGGIDAPAQQPQAQPAPAPQSQVQPPMQPMPQAAPQQPQAQPAPQPAPEPPPAQQPQVSLADRYSGAAQAPADAPIPDIPPEQTIQLPQDGNDRSGVGHAFAASRAEARQYRQLAEQLKQRLEAATAEKTKFIEEKTAFEKQLLDEQTRTKDLENQIGKLDLSKSSAFKEKYDRPIWDLRQQLAGDLAANGASNDDAAKLADAVIVAESSDEIVDMLSRFPSAVQGMAIYKWQEANSLYQQRDVALDEWRQTQAGLDQVATKETAVMSAQRRQELCDTGFDRVAKVVNFWSDPAFDKYKQAQEANVKAWYSQASDDQLAAAAIEGALVAPFAYSQIEALQNRVAELEGVLQGHTRLVSPPVAPYYSGVPTPPPPPPPPKRDPDATPTPLSAAEQLVSGTAAKYGFV